MSLFQRLNAEKGLQLPVFGTPVLGVLLTVIMQATTSATMMLQSIAAGYTSSRLRSLNIVCSLNVSVATKTGARRVSLS